MSSASYSSSKQELLFFCLVFYLKTTDQCCTGDLVERQICLSWVQSHMQALLPKPFTVTSGSRRAYPSLCLLGWQPHTRCGLCGWACWWSGYVDVTARSGGSCPRCYCIPKGWRRRPSRRWTSRSPSRHPPPLGTGADKIDSWVLASLRADRADRDTERRGQTWEAENFGTAISKWDFTERADGFSSVGELAADRQCYFPLISWITYYKKCFP